MGRNQRFATDRRAEPVRAMEDEVGWAGRGASLIRCSAFPLTLALSLRERVEMAALGPRRIEPVEGSAFPLALALALALSLALALALVRGERGPISFRQRGLRHQGRRPLSAACTQTSVGRKTGL